MNFTLPYLFLEKEGYWKVPERQMRGGNQAALEPKPSDFGSGINEYREDPP
jgi:hypothetical protein